MGKSVGGTCEGFLSFTPALKNRSDLMVSPAPAGALGAAELCEPPAGGAALQRGVASGSDRAAGAGEDGDPAASTPPAAPGKMQVPWMDGVYLMFWMRVYHNKTCCFKNNWKCGTNMMATCLGSVEDFTCKHSEAL